MMLAVDCFELLRAMVERGNPNRVTDAGVGVLCARAAVHGAALNVQVNAAGLDDHTYAHQVSADARAAAEQADALETEILDLVRAKIEV
jgi:glutamate formiminotransferase/formiminotetrahydrofolate cyclodeaminase